LQQTATQTQAKKVGEMLVERGSVTREQLLRAIVSQRSTGGRLGTCLLEMGLVEEEQLLEVLAAQQGVPAVGVDQLRVIDEEVVDLVPGRVAEQCSALPFAADDKQVDVATADARDLRHLDELAFCTNLKVRPYVTNELRIFEGLAKHYGVECPRRYSRLADRLNRRRYLWREEEIETSFPDGRVDVTWEDLDLSLPALFQVPSEPPPELPTPEATSDEDDAELGLENLGRQLAAELSGEEIGRLVLAYLARCLHRTAIFKVHNGEVRGWLARGEELDSELFDALLIRLSEPSAFHDLDRGARLHVGALPPLPAHRRIVGCWGGEWPKESLVLPVRVGDRLIAAVYGDRGPSAIPPERLDELKHVAVLMSDALELRILRRKLQTG